MGTQKRLVLASVVSMMLVLAFMVGFVPSHDAALTGASGSDGRVDMAGLLDMVLGDKAITTIVPASPVAGLTYVLPATTSLTGTPYIPVALTATAPGSVPGDVAYYVIDPRDTPGFHTDLGGRAYWGGQTDQYAGPAPQPTFPGLFDLGPKVPPTDVTSYYAISALANITNIYTNMYNGFPACIYYNVPVNQIQVGLTTVSNTDTDNNGLIDTGKLFETTALGVWVASVDLDQTGKADSQTREVVERDLDTGAKAGGDTVVISVRPDVTVEVPSAAALAAAGVVGPTDTVVAVVSVTDSLSAAIDSVDGVATKARRQQWADSTLAGTPGAVVPGAPIVQIAFIANVGGVPTELTNLLGLTAKVSLTGLADLAANTAKSVSVWGIHTSTDGSSISAAGPAGVWHVGDGAPVVDYVNGKLEAVLSSFSAFVPLYSELRITDVDPKLIPADIPVSVTLTGIFPTAMGASVYQGLTVSEATATYTVLINGVAAAFRNVDRLYTLPDGVTTDTAHEAVTLLQTNPLVDNKMYVTSPTIPVGKAAFVDVTVQSVANPANSFTLTATLQASPTGTVVVTTSGTGAGAVALNPPNGSVTLTDGTIINFPPKRYLLGAQVTATASPQSTSNFVAWLVNGTVSGNTPTLKFNVATDPTNLNAQFDLKATTFPLTIVTPVDGTIALAPLPPAGGYPAGQTVTLTAIPDPSFQFNTWNGPNANELAPSALVSPATIVMNGPKTIGASFLPIATTARLTLSANTGGKVAANPSGIGGGTLYTTGTTVVITATPSANYLFDRWTGTSAAALPDATNPVQSVIMSADKEFIANFRQVLNITAITPNNAWIFGGVVAKVSGTGLGVGTQFTLGGKTVWGFNAAANGSSIDIIVPETDDRSDNALVITTLTAAQGGVVTPAVAFTYKRYFENPGTGLNTTAFILDNPAVASTIKLDTGAGNISDGSLIIPGLSTSASQVFGIVLDQKLVVGEVKSTTEAVPAGDLSSSLIDNTAAGSGVANAYDFSIFLYKAGAAKVAPAPFTGIYVDASADLAATLGQGVDINGIPNAGNAVNVTLPLDGTGLTNADVRKGLAQWGIESQYDYAANTESVTDPLVDAYQSELLKNEVDPNLTATSAAADLPDQMLRARIYSLNGFSLRKAWTLPEDVASAIRLAKVDGTTVSGTGSGPVAGGTVLTLVSPKGGLGYVDRIVMSKSAKSSGKLGGVAIETLFVSQPGTDEYSFEFKTPKSGKAGIVDIAVYLKSSPTTPATVLTNAFEYKAKSVNLIPLLLLLLGILLAIIGIAAAVV